MHSPAITYAQHMRHGLEQCPWILLQPIWFLQEKQTIIYLRFLEGCKDACITCNSLMDTQEFDGKPCNIGTKNCRQPLQCPIRSIMQIRLKILMNTEAMLRNCNQSYQMRVHINIRPAPHCLYACVFLCVCIYVVSILLCVLVCVFVTFVSYTFKVRQTKMYSK